MPRLPSLAAQQRTLQHPSLPPPPRAAYWVMAGNEAHHCTLSGLSAGQGTGFNYMVEPWTTYDQFDVKVRWRGRGGRRQRREVRRARAPCQRLTGLLPLCLNVCLIVSPPPCLPPQIYNNFIHDVEGAGLGVWGCYDVRPRLAAPPACAPTSLHAPAAVPAVPG